MVQQDLGLGMENKMADFKLGLQFILKHEGDKLFVDTINNERSRYGITQKLLEMIDYGIKDPNSLQIADVENIYSRYYWNPNKLSEVNSQLVANKIFDMTVNMGSHTAITLVQASLNSIGGQCVIDGIMGPHTIITINEMLKIPDSEERLLSELVLKALSFYKIIAVGSKAKFLAGWTKRAEDIGMGEIDKQAYSTLRDGGKDKVIKG